MVLDHTEMIPFAGSQIEMRRAGAGRSLLLLHGCYGWWGWEPVHERLAEHFDVIAPSHPGFGRSPRVDSCDTVDDLAYFYLDLIADLGLAPATVIGFGLGGWIAAEMAVRCRHDLDRLVLAASVGIKISGREVRDIADPFILSADQQQAMLWHDPAAHQVPLPVPGLDPTLLEAMLHNQESALYYGWKPYMHNPKLRQRLHRVTAKTLVVWGTDDKIVSPSYGKAFAEGISGAQFVTVPNAGHYPHREQVEVFASTVEEFLR
jgi:pimeloyl-ACP methyl ester carboxylesterase